ncbi:hypothetical protein AB4305_26885 [Nocardia sp. 2YAB30]|uniref:hypothetical protein n=1 Tax=unclassified Nocardia TaxID=2637762 RepID=UPI003F9E1DB0
MSTDKATVAGIVEEGRRGDDELVGLIADAMSVGRRTGMSRRRIPGSGQRAAKPR